MSSSESVIGIGIETRTDASSISGLTQALTQLNTTISGLNEILSRHVSATQAITEAMKVFQSAGKDGVELSYKLSDAYNRIGVTTKEADESMVRSVATLLNKKQVSKDLVEVETEVQKAAAALADSVEKELKVTEQETKAVVQNTSAVKEQESAMMTSEDLWKSMASAKEQETQATNANTAAEEQNQTAKKKRGTSADPLIVQKSLGQASDDDRFWMGLSPKADPEAQNAAWLKLFETIMRGTGSAEEAIKRMMVAMELMTPPKTAMDVFAGEQLDKIMQMEGATLSVAQAKRLLTGETVEQIKAEQGLNEVQMQAVNAVSSQLKTVGELALARGFLNEVMANGNLTDVQRVQIGTQITKIEQEEQKILQNKAAEEISLAETEAKRLVSTGDLAGAITQLTSIQNTYNLSAKESAELQIQLTNLKNKQEAQIAKQVAEEVQLLQTQARGAMQAKDYTEAVNLLTQARDKAIGNAQLQAQVENQLAEAMRKSEIATKGNAEGIHSQWSQSFILFGASMLVNSAVQQIALTTDQKANPALSQMTRIMQEASSGGMMGMMMTGNMAGMAVGALAGAVMGLAIASTTATPEMVALNKELDNLFKKDEAADGLAKLASVSEEQARIALDAAKKNPEYAESIRNLSKEAQDAYNPIKELGLVASVTGEKLESLGISVKNFDWAQAIKVGLVAINPALLPVIFGIDQMREGYDKAKKVLDDFTGASQRAANAVSDLNYQVNTTPGLIAAAEAAVKTLTSAQKDYAKEVEESRGKIDAALVTMGEEIFKAEQSNFDSRAKAQRTYDDSIAESQYRRGEVWKDFLSSQKEAYEKYLDDQEKAFSDRKDKETDAYQVLKDKLADLSWSHLKEEDKISDELAKKRQETANKILEIEREMRQDIADLDYNASINIAKAKTEREREQIEFSTAYERSKIMQAASSKIADAQKSLADYETEEAKKKKLTDDTYTHNIDIAKREYNQKVEIAEREYRQKIALADEQYGEETRKLQENLTKQSEALDHQNELAKTRLTEQLSDLKQKLKEELDSITNNELKKEKLVSDGVDKAKKKYEELYDAANRAGQAEWFALNGGVSGKFSASMGYSSTQSLTPYSASNPDLINRSNVSNVSNSYGGNVFNIQGANAEEIWQFIRGKLELSSWQ